MPYDVSTNQNRSSAVMAQRLEPKDSLDDFPTPPWAVRALCERLLLDGWLQGEMVLREPAANRGFMARTLAEYADRVIASDVADYGAGYPVVDYLGDGGPEPDVDWTITNPPFRLAEAFIARAIQTSRMGCAMLVRTSFIEGEGRHERLFATLPPAFVLQFSERVVMHASKMLNPDVPVPSFDKKKGEFVLRKPSTATAYCWLVWRKGYTGDTVLRWTGRCRRQLERASDYDPPPKYDGA